MPFGRRAARRRLGTALLWTAPLSAMIGITGPVAILPILWGTVGLFRAAADEYRRPRLARRVARLAGLLGGAGVLPWLLFSVRHASLPGAALPATAGIVILLGGLSGKPTQSAVFALVLLAASVLALV